MLRSLHGRINLVQESSQTTRGPGDLVPRAGEKGNCPFQIHASLLGVVPGRAAPHHFRGRRGRCECPLDQEGTAAV